MATTIDTLEALVEAVRESARVERARIRDRAANESRALVEAASAHVEELERAARELGRVRGRAVEAAEERDADAEIRGVSAGAFDRLFERFVLRVRTALETLPDAPRYPAALEAWARAAARRMDGPADVRTAKRDREAVYEALLQAGAEDFHVGIDRHIRSGFVVRDPDGRTLFDRRPDAIVEERSAALRRLLEEKAPAPPPGT